MNVDRNSKPSIARRLVEMGKAKHTRDLLKMDASCSRKALLRMLDQAEAEVAAVAAGLIPYAIPFGIPIATIAPPLLPSAPVEQKPKKAPARKRVAKPKTVSPVAGPVIFVLGQMAVRSFVVCPT